MPSSKKLQASVAAYASAKAQANEASVAIKEVAAKAAKARAAARVDAYKETQEEAKAQQQAQLDRAKVDMKMQRAENELAACMRGLSESEAPAPSPDGAVDTCYEGMVSDSQAQCMASHVPLPPNSLQLPYSQMNPMPTQQAYQPSQHATAEAWQQPPHPQLQPTLQPMLQPALQPALQPSTQPFMQPLVQLATQTPLPLPPMQQPSQHPSSAPVPPQQHALDALHPQRAAVAPSTIQPEDKELWQLRAEAAAMKAENAALRAAMTGSCAPLPGCTPPPVVPVPVGSAAEGAQPYEVAGSPTPTAQCQAMVATPLVPPPTPLADPASLYASLSTQTDRRLEFDRGLSSEAAAEAAELLYGTCASTAAQTMGVARSPTQLPAQVEPSGRVAPQAFTQANGGPVHTASSATLADAYAFQPKAPEAWTHAAETVGSLAQAAPVATNRLLAQNVKLHAETARLHVELTHIQQARASESASLRGDMARMREELEGLHVDRQRLATEWQLSRDGLSAENERLRDENERLRTTQGTLEAARTSEEQSRSALRLYGSAIRAMGDASAGPAVLAGGIADVRLASGAGRIGSSFDANAIGYAQQGRANHAAEGADMDRAIWLRHLNSVAAQGTGRPGPPAYTPTTPPTPQNGPAVASVPTPVAANARGLGSYYERAAASAHAAAEARAAAAAVTAGVACGSPGFGSPGYILTPGRALRTQIAQEAEEARQIALSRLDEAMALRDAVYEEREARRIQEDDRQARNRHEARLEAEAKAREKADERRVQEERAAAEAEARRAQEAERARQWAYEEEMRRGIRERERQELRAVREEQEGRWLRAEAQARSEHMYRNEDALEDRILARRRVELREARWGRAQPAPPSALDRSQHSPPIAWASPRLAGCASERGPY